MLFSGFLQVRVRCSNCPLMQSDLALEEVYHLHNNECDLFMLAVMNDHSFFVS
jgi:hypothetical protein